MLIDVKKSCPFGHDHAAPLISTISNNSWYISIKKRWTSYFIFSLLAIWSMYEISIILEAITAHLWLPILLSLLSGVLMIQGYCKAVQKKFTSSFNLIPISGIFRTIYDVIFRPKTLLRDIDVERRQKLGDIYLMFVGLRPAIVVTSSALSKEISKTLEVYYKSDPRELNMPFFYDWVGNNNVVLANGEKWAQLRELIHHAVNEVALFVPIFNQKAKLLANSMLQEVDAQSKSTNIPLTRWLKAISLDSAGVALFGYDFKHLHEFRNQGIDAMDYVINEIFNPLRVAFPIMSRLPLPSNRKLRESMRHLDDLVNDMILHIQNNTASDDIQNVLEILIRGQQAQTLNNTELRNNILALVLASHETTQVSLSAALYYLAKYPHYQEKLRQESLSLFPDLVWDFSENSQSNDMCRDSVYKKLQLFHTMGNFILESMRLYSPLANQNPRTTTQDTTLGDYFVPKRTLVIMNIHAIHMSDVEWDNPHEFNPDRFHKGVCHNKFAYLSFGAGQRLCSGRNFSLIEQKIVLCHLLRHFRITLPEENYKVPLLRGSFTGVPADHYHLCFTRLDALK
jgi:cytochrome P450